jgi:hypothetical protein
MLLMKQARLRFRHSRDNGLVEARNGAVVHEHPGKGEIKSAYRSGATPCERVQEGAGMKDDLRPGFKAVPLKTQAAKQSRPARKQSWPGQTPSGDCSGASDGRSNGPGEQEKRH